MFCVELDLLMGRQRLQCLHLYGAISVKHPEGIGDDGFSGISEQSLQVMGWCFEFAGQGLVFFCMHLYLSTGDGATSMALNAFT